MSEEGFMQEFKDLLKKYNAGFELGDDGRPYGLHSPQATVSFFDKDMRYIRIRLPNYLEGDSE